jgi:predicted RNA-binding protein
MQAVRYISGGLVEGTKLGGLLAGTLDRKHDPNYWFLIASRQTWKYLRGKGEWAFTDKSMRKARTIREGDRGIVYLLSEGAKSPSSLGGVIEFHGEITRISGTLLFDEFYPNRMRVRTLRVSDPPEPFRSFVGRMSFIKKKDSWGIYMHGRALFNLSREDYETLFDAIHSR